MIIFISINIIIAVMKNVQMELLMIKRIIIFVILKKMNLLGKVVTILIYKKNILKICKIIY